MIFADARAHEAADIAALVNRAYRAADGRKGWTNERALIDGNRIDENGVRSMLGRIVLLRDAMAGPIIGCIHVAIDEDGAWHTSMLAVDPDTQTAGAGKAIKRKVEQEARAAGATRMRMEVIRQREALIAWHRRRGYEPTGVTMPFPYDDPSVGHPISTGPRTGGDGKGLVRTRLAQRIEHRTSQPPRAASTRGASVMRSYDPTATSRRTFVKLASLGAAGVMLPHGGGAAVGLVAARNVVLVHGLYADGSCWSEVIPPLQAKGFNVTAVQNPLTTLAESVAATRRVVARQQGATVLVGHSFAGTIISEVGVDPNVSALVYVAARAPDAGEDYTALTGRFPPPPASKGIVFDGDEGRLTEEAFLRDFAGDLPAARARALFAVQQPFNRALVTGRTTQAAWRSKPSFYAVSVDDRTIDPDLQRFMARRMKARSSELKASHLSMISHPGEIVDMIVAAARPSASA